MCGKLINNRYKMGMNKCVLNSTEHHESFGTCVSVKVTHFNINIF